MKARALAVLVAAGWLLAAAEAPAQDGAQTDLEAAKQHYKQGEQAAAKGEWRKAAREYGISYEITKDPVLFYKIANAYDQAGDCEAAVVYYKRYLKEAEPEKVEPFRAKTETRIEACEEKIAESRDADTGSESGAGAGGDTDPSSGGGGGGALPPSGEGSGPEGGGPPAFADEGPSWQRTAAWASVGGVVAFGTIGAVLGLSAQSREEDLQNLADFRDANGSPATYTGATRERYDDLVDEGESLERASLIAFAAAGVAAGAATVFFILDATGGEEEAPAEGWSAAEITPAVGPESFGVSAGWRF